MQTYFVIRHPVNPSALPLQKDSPDEVLGSGAYSDQGAGISTEVNAAAHAFSSTVAAASGNTSDQQARPRVR
jgi:hypothetical protein